VLLLLHPAQCRAVSSHGCNYKMADINGSERYPCFIWYWDVDIYLRQLHGVHILKNHVSIVSLKGYKVQTVFLMWT
jgi:hypothetical protein